MFMALNHVDDEGDSRFGDSQTNLKQEHMIPTAVYDDHEGQTQQPQASVKNNTFKKRSRTVMASPMD